MTRDSPLAYDAGVGSPSGEIDGPSELCIQQAQQGDLAAFNELVLYYQRRVYNVCFRTIGQADDAADATQEAFLHAYRAIGEFRGSVGGFQAWLLRIAVNACYDGLRRRKRRPASSLEALQESPDGELAPTFQPVDSGPGPEQRALTAETARQVQDGLDTLSADQRMVVVLCDVQGLNYEEAAGVLGIELGTVKSRLSRARAVLREYLSVRGELPAAARRFEA